MSINLNILIIDDDACEHELYEAYLGADRNYSYSFSHAYYGLEGVKLFQSGQFDCVLVDYNLPDISGLEVLKRLSARGATVPAVMVTGQEDERVAVMALKKGAFDYLPKKDVNSKSLHDCVKRTVIHERMSQRLKQYRDELERSNKDLERFATIVAHDLKAPLRAISQHLSLVQKWNEDKLDDQSKLSMGFAIDGAERMQSLIEDLFVFSKLGFEKKRMESVACDEVLTAVLQTLAPAIEEKSANITHDPLPVLWADRVQLMQVFQNIISNALKYCDGAPSIHIGVTEEEGGWLFSIQDNGIGLPEKASKTIFDIFKRLHTDEEYPGTGMGLVICDRIIKNHEGKIWATSQPGQGATFSFVLPKERTVNQLYAA